MLTPTSRNSSTACLSGASHTTGCLCCDVEGNSNVPDLFGGTGRGGGIGLVDIIGRGEFTLNTSGPSLQFTAICPLPPHLKQTIFIFLYSNNLDDSPRSRYMSLLLSSPLPSSNLHYLPIHATSPA
ncbi:unnamed protein product [Gordionus sp. m RMFG-2023]